jgi:glycosyltransferase involved in cell wall biosynthesis
VVTPSFNQGPFIEDTIRSVLCQKGDFYIDYIIMDGHSQDNSVDIIKKYENLLAKHCTLSEKNGLPVYCKTGDDFPLNNCAGIAFRWRSEPDNGQVHALKKAFGSARGNIYCWLNSDDIYVNDTVLQKVCGYFNDNPGLELLSGDGPFISKTGEFLKLHHVDRINPRELLYLDYHILQPASFFRKEVYDENRLDETLTCAFDADFFIRMIDSGVNYKKVDDSFAAFRFYEENKTQKLIHTRCKEQIAITREYSQNRFYTAVSIVYRNIQRIYESRFKKRKPFVWLWIILRRISYKLITGNWKPG